MQWLLMFAVDNELDTLTYLTSSKSSLVFSQDVGQQSSFKEETSVGNLEYQDI